MGGGTAVETSQPVDLQKVRIRRPRKRRKVEQLTDATAEAPAEVGTATAIEIEALPPAEAETQVPAEPVEATEPMVEPVAPAAVITGAEADVAPPEVADQPATTDAGTAVAARAPAGGAPETRGTKTAHAAAGLTLLLVLSLLGRLLHDERGDLFEYRAEVDTGGVVR